MKQTTFEGTVEEYQGKKLDKPIKYTGTADQFESIAEAEAAGEMPTPGIVLKWINTRKITAAKAAEYQKQTASLKEAYEASPDFKRKNLIAAAVAAGFSQAEAEAMAAQKLG